MRITTILMIAAVVFVGGGCSSSAVAPTGSKSTQLPPSVRDLGVAETPWGMRRFLESMPAKTYAAPVYPMREKHAGVTGRLVAAVYVGRNGRVIDVSVTSSSGSRALDEAGVAALRQWTYEPVIEGGAQIEFVTVQRMAFTLGE